MRVRTASCLVVVSLAMSLGMSSTSCGGSVRVGPEADSGDPATGGKGSPAEAGVSPPKTSFRAAEVQAAMAECDLAHGPAVVPATWGDLRALLVGAWIPCSTDDGGAPATLLSHPIDFAPDGTWFSMLPDSAGGLVRGQGVMNQGTYSFPTGAGDDVHADGDAVNNDPWVIVAALSHDPTPAGTFAGDLTFEASPSRIYATQYSDGQEIDTWLIALH